MEVDADKPEEESTGTGKKGSKGVLLKKIPREKCLRLWAQEVHLGVTRKGPGIKKFLGREGEVLTTNDKK